MLSQIPNCCMCSGDRPRPNQLRPRQRMVRSVRSTFLEGPRAIVEARYSLGQGLVLIASTLPAILGLLALVMPGVLFPTEGHRAFFQYACNVANDPMSLLPIAVGFFTTLLGFRIPVS